ncbi:MAG: type II toxin-antitoxin system RelE/ParE family toxin [Cyclobacteriaceae bacterium]|nr:type II toxin-antitoxin system RelE/ParE family toxin [Cyclobacteriaceae bacterium]
MSYTILLHPLAEKDFIDARSWYEERLAGLGVRFEEKIDVHLQLIRKSPLSFPKKRGTFREAKVHTFPYLIVYKFLAKKKTVLILAFHHTSRNPKNKFRR